MEEILLGVAKLSPVIGLLAYCVYWLGRRLEHRETTLETRLAEKDNKFLELHDKAITAINNNTVATNALTDYIKEKALK